MKAGKLKYIIPIICLIFLACVQEEKTPVSSEISGGRRIENLKGIHPRLLLTKAKVKELRAALKTTHRPLWDRYLQDLPRMIGVSRRTRPLGDVRYDGDLAVELAFAWLMTGEDSLLQIAKEHVLRLTDPASWEAPGELLYLIGSHFLMGISLAYDWLYPALTQEERSQIASCLGREARTQYESIVKGRIWWRNQYFQNHSHSNYCGLAFAAAALYGEDDRAAEWLVVCDEFFQKIFTVMPADGSSVEGYAYAGYGGEYILKYAMLARELLGKDYTENSWMKNYTDYMVQGLLPLCSADKWAMTFGDGPHRGWTSTAQHLFLLASLYRNSSAQWMAEFTVALRDKGLGSHGWMMLLYYDPKVGEADPAAFPTLKYFPEIGQVMMRSAWDDTSATLVGFKCGPFMGRTHSADAAFDWGTGHAEPDAGSFQIFSHGRFLALGALYTGFKLSGNHNTVLIKERGQLGDEMPGFASIEALKFGHYPEILHTLSTESYDYVVGDVAKAYHPALGLKRYLRHLLFVKPDILVVADEFTLEEKGIVYNYRCQDIKTGPTLSRNRSGQVVGSQGEAFVIFDGVQGTYRIYICYLDNDPGAAEYSLAVDGKIIHSWKSMNEDRDDNLIEVTPAVELKKGSRISFRGRSMPEDFRLTKMAAFSKEVPVPRRAQWLMHFDPAARISSKASRITAALDGTTLDLYALAPAERTVNWESYEILRADLEPFNYHRTKRLVIEPVFRGNDLTMLTLLHAKTARFKALENVKAALENGQALIDWTRDGKRFSLNWDLQNKKINLSVPQSGY